MHLSSLFRYWRRLLPDGHNRNSVRTELGLGSLASGLVLWLDPGLGLGLVLWLGSGLGSPLDPVLGSVLPLGSVLGSVLPSDPVLA